MLRASEIRSIKRPRGMASSSAVVSMIIALCVGSFLIVPKANAQSEDQIMAAFLFNFARYVEWPDDAFGQPGSPVEICILGADYFSDIVSKIVSGKAVGNRSAAVRSVTNLKTTQSCHILFIGRDVKTPYSEIIRDLRDMNVFAVADREGFAVAGGIANFFRADNRIRFEINPSAANKAGLKISSRLLRLAKVVK